MIAFLEKIVQWTEFIDDTETHGILGDCTFKQDIGPFKVGQHVDTLQLACAEGAEEVFLEEVDIDGKIINRVEVVMVEKALVESFKREILELRAVIRRG